MHRPQVCLSIVCIGSSTMVYRTITSSTTRNETIVKSNSESEKIIEKIN